MTAAAPLAANAGLTLFPILMIWAGVADVVTLRISNRLVTVSALLFFPLALASEMPLGAMAIHLAVAAVLLIFGFCLFSFRIIGAGDAKLLSAAGLWLGFPCVMPFLLYSAAAGGVLAGAIGLWSALTAEVSFHSDAMGHALERFRPNVPYGFALAIGSILALPFSWWMAAAPLPT